MNHSTDLNQFRSAMCARGIIPPQHIIADGALHRCDVEGKPGKKDAAYALYLDGGLPVGGFENLRDGQGWQNWLSDNVRVLSKDENRQFLERMNVMFAQNMTQIAKIKRTEISAAQYMYARGRRGSRWHPYVVNKGIRPYIARSMPIDEANSICTDILSWTGGISGLSGNLLLIPLRHIEPPRVSRRLFCCSEPAYLSVLASRL